MSFFVAATPGAALRSRSAALVAHRCLSTALPRPAEKSAPKPIDSSTSALDYKMHRPPRRLPQPAAHPRAPSAEEAVTNILYNTPAPSTEPYSRHLLNCLVQNEPGVLSRVSGILAGRGFNIDSLVVCQTEIRDLSRMCIVLKGQDGVVEQARRQLEDLVPVWAVLDYTNTPIVERELLLAKLSIYGPEYAQAQLSGGPTHDQTFDHAVAHQTPSDPPPFVDSGATDQNPTQNADKLQRELALARSFENAALPPGLYPSRQEHMSSSEALIAKNLHFTAIKTLAEQFGGKVVDVAEGSCIVEVTGKSSRIDNFLSLVRPFGVLEAARSGVMVLPRTPIAKYGGDEEVMIQREELDASMLPPG